MRNLPFSDFTAMSHGFSLRFLATPLYRTVNCPSANTSDNWMYSRGNSHLGSMPMAEAMGVRGEGGSSELS